MCVFGGWRQFGTNTRYHTSLSGNPLWQTFRTKGKHNPVTQFPTARADGSRAMVWTWAEGPAPEEDQRQGPAGLPLLDLPALREHASRLQAELRQLLGIPLHQVGSVQPLLLPL